MEQINHKARRKEYRRQLAKYAAMLKPSCRQPMRRRSKRLDKEVLECYREGRAWATKYAKGELKIRERERTVLYENSPMRESIKKMGGGSKFFGENLKPLKAYLYANIGKSWNKIYGHLCQRLDRRTVSGNHIFEHIGDFVDIGFFDRYTKSDIDRFLRCHKVSLQVQRPYRMFIHPRTGILCAFVRK